VASVAAPPARPRRPRGGGLDDLAVGPTHQRRRPAV